jgi:arsenite methyltransferase
MAIRKKDIKDIVRSKYDQIAKQSDNINTGSCCSGTSCCETVDYTVFSDDYSDLEGYMPDADLNLGCGIPTEYAGIGKGMVVLDLGSGAGNDCFVVRSIVGEEGKVIGIDFADQMLKKARKNAKELGFENVQFIKSDIESMAIPDQQIDVVISNCVLNLVPDKRKAFGEIYRVLKPGGHFCVSDVVIKGELPETLINDAEMYAGCVAGAVDINEYLNHIQEEGFTNIEINKEKKITIPDDILNNYLNPEELKIFKESDTGILSITINAEKQ